MVFAHRGACKYAPENTLASFQLALAQGAEAIELDAKLSADGEVVVIHDPTVDRTTDGTGRVNQLTLQELKRLDAGSFFAEKYIRGKDSNTG
jgi:glycerophosphoryl diester phosphodiesterase